jgi:4-aminobutyrate aminotransferase-like enzyme
VITRPEVLKSYCDEVGYFNTFAGSAVAAAAGQAVLEIIERENLMGNALDVGRHLFTGLRRLCERHPLLSAVRGAGLYLGVQVRSAQLASDIVNALRDRGVLISLCGLNADVLKIRPPLCFAKEDADLLLSALDETLSAIGSL